MKPEWEVVGDYSVEIWFRIQKDKDGYPESKEWEQLLARPVIERDDYFRIESIPFYLKNVSRGDIVAAKAPESSDIQDEKGFEFGSVVDRGGHNTYRLLLRKKRPDDPEFTESELLDKGLGVETEYGDFFAIDVPPSVDQPAIDDYLVAESKSGRWEMQDGYLHSIRTTQPKDPET
jgi:Domain of unknown function (DUF4265)